MAEKKLTPIQEAINRTKGLIKDYQKMRGGWKIGTHQYQAYDFHVNELFKDLEYLSSLLPKEKEFAGDMWDGGYNKGYEDAGDDSFVGKKNPVPDFFNYLKQYEP